MVKKESDDKQLENLKRFLVNQGTSFTKSGLKYASGSDKDKISDELLKESTGNMIDFLLNSLKNLLGNSPTGKTN